MQVGWRVPALPTPTPHTPNHHPPAPPTRGPAGGEDYFRHALAVAEEVYGPGSMETGGGWGVRVHGGWGFRVQGGRWALKFHPYPFFRLPPPLTPTTYALTLSPLPLRQPPLCLPSPPCPSCPLLRQPLT